MAASIRILMKDAKVEKEKENMEGRQAEAGGLATMEVDISETVDLKMMNVIDKVSKVELQVEKSSATMDLNFINVGDNILKLESGVGATTLNLEKVSETMDLNLSNVNDKILKLKEEIGETTTSLEKTEIVKQRLEEKMVHGHCVLLKDLKTLEDEILKLKNGCDEMKSCWKLELETANEKQVHAVHALQKLLQAMDERHSGEMKTKLRIMESKTVDSLAQLEAIVSGMPAYVFKEVDDRCDKLLENIKAGMDLLEWEANDGKLIDDSPSKKRKKAKKKG